MKIVRFAAAKPVSNLSCYSILTDGLTPIGEGSPTALMAQLVSQSKQKENAPRVFTRDAFSPGSHAIVDQNLKRRPAVTACSTGLLPATIKSRIL